MNEIKIFQMGFGESIMFSYENSCLLVDCGSESVYKNEYFKNILLELRKYENCSAMLTHFHEDHINGFMWLINEQPHLFEKVFIPHIFTTNHPNLTDLELIKYVLEQIFCPGSHTVTIWNLLKLLCRKNQKITLLKRQKSAFQKLDDNFDVLWPVPTELVSSQLAKKITDNFSQQFLEQVFYVSELISDIYLTLTQNHEEISLQRYTSIEQQIHSLTEIYFQANEHIIRQSYALKLIDSIRSNANKASIVCHNNGQGKSILLTGDIPCSIMKKISQNKNYSDIPIEKEYNIIKAPHHGTDTHYFNFGCVTNFKQLLISNGETSRGTRGRISRQYNLLKRDYKIVCTNLYGDRCQSMCSYPYTVCLKLIDTCGCERKNKFILI